MKTITVTDAFYLGGEAQEVGAVIEVSDILACELIANHRAEETTEAPFDETPAAPKPKKGAAA